MKDNKRKQEIFCEEPIVNIFHISMDILKIVEEITILKKVVFKDVCHLNCKLY